MTKKSRDRRRLIRHLKKALAECGFYENFWRLYAKLWVFGYITEKDVDECMPAVK